MRCESTAWPRVTGTQCATFLPHNTSLDTLPLAEAACAANPECGAVSDLYCNGMHPEYPDDHYALCNGAQTGFQAACSCSEGWNEGALC